MHNLDIKIKNNFVLYKHDAISIPEVKQNTAYPKGKGKKIYKQKGNFSRKLSPYCPYFVMAKNCISFKIGLASGHEIHNFEMMPSKSTVCEASLSKCCSSMEQGGY